jgi:hypothetical protein
MTDLHPKFSKGEVVTVLPISEHCVCTGAVALSYEVMNADGRKLWVSDPDLQKASTSLFFWKLVEQKQKNLRQIAQLSLDEYSMNYRKTSHNTE